MVMTNDLLMNKGITEDKLKEYEFIDIIVASMKRHRMSLDKQKRPQVLCF